MANDGPARRSIQVNHKNLDTLHFRAYALDLVEQIDSSEDYNALPGYREVPEIISSRLPDAEWSVELPYTSKAKYTLTNFDGAREEKY